MDERAKQLGKSFGEFFTLTGESISKAEEKLRGIFEQQEHDKAGWLKKFQIFPQKFEEMSKKVDCILSDLDDVKNRVSKLEAEVGVIGAPSTGNVEGQLSQTEGRSVEKMSSKKPADMMSAQKSVDATLLVKPCETIPERSVKKRRVMSMEVEDEEKVGDEEMEPVSQDPPGEFVEGKRVDVKALLSTEARNFLVTTKGGETVPIDSLDGKYVLVCCFLVPFQTDRPEASVCRSLEALFHELSIERIVDGVKLVVVAKIATGFGEAEFDSFFSTLSLDCLAIPFSDSISRDKVCKSLHLRPDTTDHVVPCLAVHPDCTVLQFDPFFLLFYGANSFPFTEEHFDNIWNRDETIRERIRSTDSPISVMELLQCEYLSRIADESSRVPTFNLSNNRDTVVALYLYYDGKFMAELREIHKKCIAQGHKCEIVLVPLPFERHYDPASFYNLMIQSASEDYTSSSWLVFPFNDKICRTLWRLCHCCRKDRLIIMPQGERPGDLWGRHIASSYGIVAYPFTRDDVVRMKVTDDMSESEILDDLEDEARSAG